GGVGGRRGRGGPFTGRGGRRAAGPSGPARTAGRTAAPLPPGLPRTLLPAQGDGRLAPGVGSAAPARPGDPRRAERGRGQVGRRLPRPYARRFLAGCPRTSQPLRPRRPPRTGPPTRPPRRPCPSC